MIFLNLELITFQKAEYAILLSGTPALSRPIELFKQVHTKAVLFSYIMTMLGMIKLFQNLSKLNFAAGSLVS